MEAHFFDSHSAFRLWLQDNYDKEKELWIGYYKKNAAQKGISYTEAVEEALCFGWIDGKAQRIDEERYRQRFTPRKPKSIWSSVNIKRIEKLKDEGRLHASGLKVFQERDESKAGLYAFEQAETPVLTEAYNEQFKKNDDAWAWWVRQPESYRKAAAWLVISAKREETRLKRLERLIADSANGERVKELRPL